MRWSHVTNGDQGSNQSRYMNRSSVLSEDNIYIVTSQTGAPHPQHGSTIHGHVHGCAPPTPPTSAAELVCTRPLGPTTACVRHPLALALVTTSSPATSRLRCSCRCCCRRHSIYYGYWRLKPRWIMPRAVGGACCWAWRRGGACGGASCSSKV